MDWDMFNTTNSTAMDNYAILCHKFGFDCSNATSYNTSNGTDPSYYDFPSDWCEAGEAGEETIRIFQTWVFCLVFLLGMAGNCLVMATFILYRRLRQRSMTDVFLFHLALADFLLLLTLPLQAVDTHLGWVFSAALCRAMRASHAINTYSGLLLLACISVDRYLVVVRANDVLRLRGQILLGGKLAALGVWVVAVLLSLPEILFSGLMVHGRDTYCALIKSGRIKMATNSAIVAVFCMSFLVMTTCYSLIALALREGSTQRRAKCWRRQRTLRLMVALVLVFLVFQLPYTLVLSRKMAGQFCGLLLEYITCTLAYARCCLNPILYALVGVRFRSDVLRLMRDLGCLCTPTYLGAQAASSSTSALSALSACPPTYHGRSYSSIETPSFSLQEPNNI